MALYLDNYPLQCIMHKKESPGVHSLGFDVLVTLLNIKSSHCIVREKNYTIQRLFGSLLRAYCLHQTAKTYSKNQGNIRQCGNKPTEVNNHIPTINKRAVNLTAVASEVGHRSAETQDHMPLQYFSALQIVTKGFVQKTSVIDTGQVLLDMDLMGCLDYQTCGDRLSPNSAGFTSRSWLWRSVQPERKGGTWPYLPSLTPHLISHILIFPALKGTGVTMSGGCRPSASSENKSPEIAQVNVVPHTFQEKVRLTPSKFEGKNREPTHDHTITSEISL